MENNDAETAGGKMCSTEETSHGVGGQRVT